jgi:Tol biopolymer transport system component/predicted Ser/Thr protein kinase
LVSARDQQIRALYKAALERPAAERASFVADLSGGDQELCQSVELMLSRHGATDVGASAAAPAEATEELAAATEIGTYRIDGVLGRGGMGVVYRATDNKLHRPVAIKFLSIVADEQAKRRFRQEAETASSLNHPHIVTVYDVGEHGGQQYIVSELVEGGTLEEWNRTTRRKGWRQSVELLTGVADALAAAHAAGVLHRDVKPGNVLIDANGYAKLADFGLAKLVDRGGRDPAESIAKISKNTRAGLVLGTVAYMSPEQASGQPVDERSDVFSFGIVLYELIAGHRPFEAGNELELLKSIVHAPAAPLPDGIPELLRMAVDKALQKDPADRYQTMRDLVADLRRVTRTASAAMTALRAAESSRGSRVPWVLAAGLALVLVAALVPATLYFLRAPPRAAPRIVYELPVPGFAGRNGDLAISPDATRIAYVANVNGAQRIWVRSIGSLDARELTGTENAGGIFWSPDDRYVAFTAGGDLKRIDTAGGPVQNVADSLLGAQGAWGPDGTILFSTPPSSGGGIVVIGRVSANGGSVTPVTAFDTASGQLIHALPALLPGGDRFLYVSTGGATSTARAGSAQRGDLKPVIGLERAASGITYAGGFVLYVRDNALVAQRFDTTALAVHGTPVALAERVGQFSVAGDALVYSESGSGNDFTSNPQRLRRLAWVDRRGQPLGEIDAPVGYMTPVLSPDEHRLAVRAPDPAGSSGDIWTIDMARGIKTRLTSDPADEGTPLWSPDGTRLVFGSGRSGNAAIPNAIYQRAANGTGADELLFAAQAGEVVAPLTWSADGSFLLFGRALIATFRTKIAIWKLELTGERTATPLLDAPFVFGNAQLSPDGRWLAYTSTESGATQIVVQSFPDLSRDKRQVSTTGGYEPRWRGDGRELFYLAPDGALMALDVPAGDALEPGAPRKLFSTGIPVEASLSGQRPDYFYAAAVNGDRFLLNEPLAASASAAPNDAPPATPTIHVIVNWATGLPER